MSATDTVTPVAEDTFGRLVRASGSSFAARPGNGLTGRTPSALAAGSTTWRARS